VRKKIFLGLLLLFVAAQFWRPARNAAAAPGPNDINVKHPVPAKVQALLQRACYDCHSNNTHYPWYAAVQPVRWWLDGHINEGKQHLDFSDFGSYTAKRAAKRLEEVDDEVTDHRMPLPSYIWMHPAARLTPDEIKLLANWAESLRDEIAP
jgi:hypothetical protein